MFTLFKKVHDFLTIKNLGLILLLVTPVVLSLIVLLRNTQPYSHSTTVETSANNQFDLAIQELNLLPSKYISPKYIDGLSRVYRSLSGPGTISFTPSRTIQNSELNLILNADNLVSIPEEVEVKKETLDFKYLFNFESEIPETLTGEVYHYDNFAYFDGQSSLTMSSSSDLFESGPLSIYVRWSPQDVSHSMQQIIGHFNWEIWQNSNSVEFRVGRLDGNDGEIVSIAFPVSDSFFGNEHEAFAVYSPGEFGYIELIVDGKHAGRKYIGNSTIFKAYGSSNLSLGWTQHNFGRSPHYIGNIYEVGISESVLEYNKTIKVGQEEKYEYRWHIIPVIENNSFRSASVNISNL